VGNAGRVGGNIGNGLRLMLVGMVLRLWMLLFGGGWSGVRERRLGDCVQFEISLPLRIRYPVLLS